MKKEAMLAKIEAEPDQGKRIWTLIQYIMENGSQEVKDQAEKVLKAATA